MEIKIGIGVKNIFFGMTQDEIEAILGEPNRIVRDEELGWITYDFNEEMLRLVFSKDNKWKLTTIEVHHQNIGLFDENLLNKTQEEIKHIMTEHGYNKVEYENYDAFESLFYDDVFLSFIFEFDRLQHIEFSPLYDDDDNIIWPKRE